MEQPPSSGDLFRCRSCGNLGLGHGEIRCCESVMQPVRGDFDVEEPSLEELIRVVFGMSRTELDLCLCVMEGGELTVKELAEQVEYDRSVVSRHLNHLTTLGVIDKRRRVRKEGGQVYVYTPNEPDAVRRSLTGAFLSWVHEATSLIDAMNREKVETMVESETEPAEWKIYRE